MLMNMEGDTEDWANDISKIMASALIKNNIFDEKWKKKQEKWLSDYKNAVIAGDTARMNALKEQQKQWMEEDKATAQMYMDAVGYDETDKQQKATFNSAKNISYEQADSLVGIATGQQVVLERSLQEHIAQTELQSGIAQKLEVIQPAITDIKDNIAIITEAQATMNDHLANISRFTSVLPEMQEDLYRIRKTIEE